MKEKVKTLVSEARILLSEASPGRLTELLGELSDLCEQLVLERGACERLAEAFVRTSQAIQRRVAPGLAIHGDRCQRCIDYRPGDRCAHEVCEHPGVACPPDLSGLAARESQS